MFPHVPTSFLQETGCKRAQAQSLDALAAMQMQVTRLHWDICLALAWNSCSNVGHGRIVEQGVLTQW